MSIFEQLRPRWRPPQCCRACRHLDQDIDEWRDQTFWFCNLNIWFPTKKQSCKRQELR